MANPEDNIPTLSDVVQPGNEDMLNHFDAHQFEDEAPEETAPPVTTDSSDELATPELTDIPSITLHEDSPSDLVGEDFSDAMQSLEKNMDSDEIKEKIDLAIVEALTEIEISLKDKLYRKFNIKVDQAY